MKKKDPTFEEIIRMRAVLTVPGMNEVSARRDLVYKAAEDRPLHMDLYSPPGPSRPRPAVALVHGGPLPRTGAKNMGVFVSYGEMLAASGFVAVAFDHRFLAPDRLADAGQDVADLIAHVRSNADSLGVDAGRLALWAFSGGGPFLAPHLRERPTWLRAVVAYYAVLDLKKDPRFSPVLALGTDARTAPPLLVARAGLDNASLNEGADRFVRAATAGGAMLDLLNHPRGRHAFDILDDDARSRQIIRCTLAFLRDHLGP
jgi:acetyl esterase/lipase